MLCEPLHVQRVPSLNVGVKEELPIYAKGGRKFVFTECGHVRFISRARLVPFVNGLLSDSV